MTQTATTKHEPLIGYDRKRHVFPYCSCGWTGDITYDYGEATRKAYAHAKAAMYGPLSGKAAS